MENFESFLSEGKKIQIKRKYTENHPASTVGKTANVRNEVLKAVKDGVITEEEFSKIVSKLSKSPNRWRSTNSKYFFVSEEGVKLSKWGLRILSELDVPSLKAFPVHEAIKITKDDWPIIKFKDGGKKYEVEFDDYDVIDDHGNEGKDVYFMGTDQDGKEWTIDASVGYNFDNSGNIDDIHYDTLARMDESIVNEKDDAGTHLDKLAELVGKAKSFMDVGKELKAGKYKYDFGTGMMPHYQVKADGFNFMIVNKKYVDKGDREVNDIAIGLLENTKTQTTDIENTFLIH